MHGLFLGFWGFGVLGFWGYKEYKPYFISSLGQMLHGKVPFGCRHFQPFYHHTKRAPPAPPPPPLPRPLNCKQSFEDTKLGYKDPNLGQKSLNYGSCSKRTSPCTGCHDAA